jgi:hypothetical protein
LEKEAGDDEMDSFAMLSFKLSGQIGKAEEFRSRSENIYIRLHCFTAGKT